MHKTTDSAVTSSVQESPVQKTQTPYLTQLSKLFLDRYKKNVCALKFPNLNNEFFFNFFFIPQNRTSEDSKIDPDLKESVSEVMKASNEQQLAISQKWPRPVKDINLLPVNEQVFNIH